MQLTLSLVKMAVGLVVVIILINLFLKFLQKYTVPQDNKLQVLKKIPVTKTSALGIVQVVDRYYLMSLAEAGSSILTELSATEAEQLLEPKLKSDMDEKKFANVLIRRTERLKKREKK
ncbi:hypothetical protein LFYK43_13820 [Ligilactobacillus salitolerans]|uniref:Flagellar protein FliO/FliZ n=1 Tax=Ligilactobacillus salitolerans TaxID=1808352 RepID=A0A401ITP0_9LACO|nr:flagellar biosynthetic protein FliO [Ligilactobacillus salitolerans]GBG94923.1 hypothetical protein LFYK43_13820 [Ligilactobacillus salitolerans]